MHRTAQHRQGPRTQGEYLVASTSAPAASPAGRDHKRYRALVPEKLLPLQLAPYVNASVTPRPAI